MSTTDICFMTATELARRIRSKELSARAVMEAHLAQIERVNPTVNAIVTLLPEGAMAGARAADEALAHSAAVGPLHGLPIAHKDLILTKGIRTTYGSRIYADFVPDQDMLIVERMRNCRPGALFNEHYSGYLEALAHPTTERAGPRGARLSDRT